MAKMGEVVRTFDIAEIPEECTALIFLRGIGCDHYDDTFVVGVDENSAEYNSVAVLSRLEFNTYVPILYAPLACPIKPIRTGLRLLEGAWQCSAKTARQE